MGAGRRALGFRRGRAVRLVEFALLADENIHPDVVAGLRAEGRDVTDVRGCGLAGSDDAAIIEVARAHHRVVLTHDKDFGILAIARLQPLLGVVFVRPGHIDPRFTLETLRLLFDKNPETPPPFLLVARRAGNVVAIRVRNL